MSILDSRTSRSTAPTTERGTGVTEQQKESDGSTSTTTRTYDNLMRLTGKATGPTPVLAHWPELQPKDSVVRFTKNTAADT
jgi:hypothetical protein